MGWPGGQPASLAEHAVWPAGWAHSSKPTSQCGWLAAVQLAGQLAGWLSSWLAHWLACCWPAARWRELRTFTLRPFARGPRWAPQNPWRPGAPGLRKPMGPWEPKGLAPKGNVNPPSTEREKMVKLIFFSRGPQFDFFQKV